MSHPFTTIHIAKSLEKSTARPKLVKEYGCPIAREEQVATKLEEKWLQNIKGQLVTMHKRNAGQQPENKACSKIKFTFPTKKQRKNPTRTTLIPTVGVH